MTNYDVTWHHKWRHFMLYFKKNTISEDLFARKTAIYRFNRFSITYNIFYGYFNDLTKFWPIMTSYDVINDVILCWILRKAQYLEIWSPRKPQYIDFIGFYPQIIYFYCYFNDLMKFWPIMTSHDVKNCVILCRISRKVQNMDIYSPRKPQYIEFIDIPHK